jgi:hypothetical protein
MIRRLLVALTIYWLSTSAVFGHAWHEDIPDMAPAQVEAVVAALEAAAETAGETWHPTKAGAGDSTAIAYQLLSGTGDLAALTEDARRVLATLDALLAGAVDETGAWTSDEQFFDWVEVIRPEDAVTVAPFRARLEAWFVQYLARAE